MSDSTATSHVAPKAYRSSPLPDLKLFMWLFLASDCMFFGTLIGTYLVYRGRSLQGRRLVLPQLWQSQLRPPNYLLHAKVRGLVVHCLWEH